MDISRKFAPTYFYMQYEKAALYKSFANYRQIAASSLLAMTAVYQLFLAPDSRF